MSPHELDHSFEGSSSEEDHHIGEEDIQETISFIDEDNELQKDGMMLMGHEDSEDEENYLGGNSDIMLQEIPFEDHSIQGFFEHKRKKISKNVSNLLSYL